MCQQSGPSFATIVLIIDFPDLVTIERENLASKIEIKFMPSLAPLRKVKGKTGMEDLD